MALIGKTNEEKIWNYLYSELKNSYAVAGLIGNLKGESGLNPINLQNTGNKKLGMTDEQYTAAVDNGSYKDFINDKQGYGLAQWTYWSRKQNLLNYANSKGVSIGDLEMQLEFLVTQELQIGYRGIWNKLISATSVRQASDIILTEFEKPANQSESVKVTRARYGQESYDLLSDEKYYRVQCGAFSVKENALALELKLKQAGFSTTIKQINGLYKVQLGAFKNKANAESMLYTVKSRGFDAFLTYC